MSEQALDLKRSALIIRRYLRWVTAAACLGLVAGTGYVIHDPPAASANALVVLPTSVHDTSTQVLVATSDQVLEVARRNIKPVVSLPTLQSRVQVVSLTPNVLSFTAQGATSAQAKATVIAVADSYVSYVGSARSVVGQVSARLLQPVPTVRSRPLFVSAAIYATLGAAAGAVIGAIIVLAIGRGDRRLRLRDELADAIGVPVLGSLTVELPTTAARWVRLFEDYRPSATTTWRFHKVLQYLGLAGESVVKRSTGRGLSVTVLSLSTDRKALALGPLLAVSAASDGVPTELVIGPPPDVSAAAALRAACAGQRAANWRADRLSVSVADVDTFERRPGTILTVVVSVVDIRKRNVADTIRTDATVLAVSAGGATAEQLAQLAASVAAAGRELEGILVADPDAGDSTTGRMPHLVRPGPRNRPTRLTRLLREATP